ncbi:aldehyde dehydrogenase [Sphingomonas oleivorans]|uniref:Aldehyde dehydrogenase n=1 Tax=Sphingomonas oleivorans TaxID=1735121 RepID=A0A2T5FYY0_9SPHN|nr:xanthine dehydrogenase family protein molybdopterin-binding subunit [Sphingomonas oleivorans]PTQ11816.1 aldehyde dehydrogenase [Sphingomonas oleivorans]
MPEALFPTVDRRAFLKGGTGLLFAIGFADGAIVHAAEAPAHFEPSAFIRLSPDGTVTLTMTQVEMGQGAQTGLAMIIAEELDVDLDQVQIEQAMADEARYGPQMTGGSTSIREGWKPMRTAGATARAMLVSAAAARWKVDATRCSTHAGAVIHSLTEARIAYGELVADAAKLPIPTDVPLKDPGTFRLIGHAIPRIEGSDKVSGRAQFGIDVAMPGCKIATVAACPVFGGTLASVDETAALAMPGVSQVIRLRNAVAVITNGMASARKGMDALKIQWNEAPHAELSSAKIFADLDAATTKPGVIARRAGRSIEGAPGTRIEALYRQPFLAHTPIEPMNCTVHVTDSECRIWTGTQSATEARKAVARQLGIALEKVAIHIYLMGGGFGRRLEFDGIQQAVEIGRHVDGPVQIIWTREEDIQHDMYRPAYADRIAATLGADGKPATWHHRIAGSSIIARLYPKAYQGVDFDAVECAAEPAYDLANIQVEFARVESGVPTSWWRGVGPTRSLFVVESFIDELAHAAGMDPVDYRRSLISDPRLKVVLETAAKEARWGARLSRHHAQGIALMRAFGSYAAMVAEISMEEGKAVRLRRVTVAIDCGVPINPDMIRAQMEGGVVFGASAALAGEITVQKGRVEQASFADYPALRISEAPIVETHIIAGGDAPGGVGEVGTAGIAPAIANAIFAATGKRIRQLPINGQMKVWTG